MITTKPIKTAITGFLFFVSQGLAYRGRHEGRKWLFVSVVIFATVSGLYTIFTLPFEIKNWIVAEFTHKAPSSNKVVVASDPTMSRKQISGGAHPAIGSVGIPPRVASLSLAALPASPKAGRLVRPTSTKQFRQAIETTNAMTTEIHPPLTDPNDAVIAAAARVQPLPTADTPEAKLRGELAAIGDRVFFLKGSDELSPVGMMIVRGWSGFLKEHPDLKITLASVGYSVPNSENEDLSDSQIEKKSREAKVLESGDAGTLDDEDAASKRLLTIKNYLVRLGNDARRIGIVCTEIREITEKPVKIEESPDDRMVTLTFQEGSSAIGNTNRT